MQATAGIVAGVQAFFIGNFSGLASRAFASEPVSGYEISPVDTDLETSFQIWLAGSATCDVIIAVSMAYFVS